MKWFNKISIIIIIDHAYSSLVITIEALGALYFLPRFSLQNFCLMKNLKFVISRIGSCV